MLLGRQNDHAVDHQLHAWSSVVSDMARMSGCVSRRNRSDIMH